MIRTFGIKTGDIVLFSGNMLTATLLKWGTGSRWNHAGIGVWIEDGRVTIESGELFIFEINTTPRLDAISGQLIKGIGFTQLEYTLEIYNTVGVRSMDESYRKAFMERIIDFYHDHSELQFNRNTFKFIRGWWGVRGTTDIHDDGVFCTEMMAMAYSYCLDRPIERILRCPDLSNDLCVPSHYTYKVSPRSSVFPYPESIFRYKNEYFINSVIILLVVTVILILMAILITKVAEMAIKKACQIDESAEDSRTDYTWKSNVSEYSGSNSERYRYTYC